MINSSYTREKRNKKIEDEEKELEELMQASKEPKKEDKAKEKEPEEEEVQEEEPSSPEEKTFKKRYGDLRRYMNQKEKEWEEKFEALKNEKGSLRPPKSDEDLKSWAKQNPEAASIIETIAQKKAQELFSKAEGRLKEFDEAQYEAQRVKAENTIRKAHEDFDELRASEEFHEWAEEQPKWVQDALYENTDDAASVIRVIDLYKVDKGLTPSAQRSKTRDAAKSVSTSSKPSIDSDESSKKIYESDVAKMSDKKFEENWEAIQKAQREGNFVYDISGGAR